MNRANALKWTGTRVLAAWIACLCSLPLGQPALAQVPSNGSLCLDDTCLLPSGAIILARTWVSGVGDDGNTCGRTDPCKTIAAALSRTIGGGEIDVLDQGDFGAAVITSAITIEGVGGGRAALSNGGTSSIIVNAGPGDVVIFRNLSFHDPSASIVPGVNGISFQSGQALHIENSIISNFTGHGIDFEPANGGSLFLKNVVTRGNGKAGVYVASSASLSPVNATIVKSASLQNAVGFQVGGNAKMSLYRSTAAQNSDAGLLVSVADTSGGEMSVEEMVLTENAVGVRTESANGNALARLSKALITGNATAPTAIGGNGRILSYGNNRIVGGSVTACAPGTLTFTPSTLTAVTKGVDYVNVYWTVNGAMGQVMFSEDGALPAGVVFNSGGLTGIPTETGTFAFTVTATDDFNCTASASFQLLVSPPADTVAADTTPRPSNTGCNTGTEPLGLSVLLLGLALLRRRKARA